MSEEPKPQPEPLAVLRCAQCGDTFPVEGREGARCPSCGSDRLEVAREPLL